MKLYKVIVNRPYIYEDVQAESEAEARYQKILKSVKKEKCIKRLVEELL